MLYPISSHPIPSHVRVHSPPHTRRCEEFAEAIVGLNAAYLTRIKAQIVKWVQNLRAQQLEVQLDADGHYVTTLPDDMFNLINMQARWWDWMGWDAMQMRRGSWKGWDRAISRPTP